MIIRRIITAILCCVLSMPALAAVGLDATGDQLIRTTNLPSASTAQTACGWFRRDADRNNYSVLLWFTNAGGATYSGLSFNVDGTTPAVFGTGTGAQETNFTGGGIPAQGAWFFACLVQSGTTVTGYISPEGSATVYTAAATATNYTPASFGAGNDGTGSFLNGALQNIRVFNSALNQAAVEAEKAATAAVAAELFDWRCNNTTDCNDISGNARNPTIGGTLTNQTGPTIGGGSDTTPNAFSFTDQTNVALSSTITSAAVTITGIDATTTCTPTGGTIDVNSDANFQATRDVVNNDTIRARHTSSASNSTATNTPVSCGGVSDTFTSTTVAAGSIVPIVYYVLRQQKR